MKIENLIKIETITRELVLYWAAIFLYPFKTIRCLIWQWHFWIQKTEIEIEKDHNDFFSKYDAVNKKKEKRYYETNTFKISR